MSAIRKRISCAIESLSFHHYSTCIYNLNDDKQIVMEILTKKHMFLLEMHNFLS